MAVTASKTFLAGEILTASDLNGEIANILDQGQSIGFPRTAEAEFAGNELWLDSDKDSSFTMDSDDQLDLKLKGTDLFRWFGVSSAPVNGVEFIASNAGVVTTLRAFSVTETNVSLNITGKGTGEVLIDGAPIGDTILRAVSSNQVARSTKLRVMDIEANHIGEVQTLSF